VSDNENQFLTVKEIAKEFGVPAWKAERAAKQGALDSGGIRRIAKQGRGRPPTEYERESVKKWVGSVSWKTGPITPHERGEDNNV
jgi:hypothetical protein